MLFRPETRRRRATVRPTAVVALLAGAAALGVPLASPQQASAATDPPALRSVRTAPDRWAFVDPAGREVTLRGFNVAAGTKLVENGFLPFRTTGDAARSAQAMRDLTGANVVRFGLGWEGVQPTPGAVDIAYLERAAAQIRQFTDRGINVLLDWHQDLHSRHLFEQGSWYTGNGAPAWVVRGAGYPKESCGLCVTWGQNMQTNKAVRSAADDFWHNRVVTTSSGPVAVQDAYVRQLRDALAYFDRTLPASARSRVIGVDPFNEPFPGTDAIAGTEFERRLVMPFYRRARAAMDTAGWSDTLLFAEPVPFWNVGASESGGLSTVGALPARMVFNTHLYDGLRLVINPFPTSDGEYSPQTNEIRSRASTLQAAPIVSEFGNGITGVISSHQTPLMLKTFYQGLDSGLAGSAFWRGTRAAGDVTSSIQWHWDLASGRHREPMNGNPAKVQTAGDAWNGEDFSVVRLSSTGEPQLRVDRRLLDRVYPAAVDGHRLAFGYEDQARVGPFGGPLQWLTVPSTMPATKALTDGRQYAVLTWRGPESGSGGLTELHLPASFDPASTVVVSDVATVAGLPSTGPVRVAAEPGSTTARRVVVDTAGGAPGALHGVLVVSAPGGSVAPDTLARVRAELTTWAVA